MTAAHAYNEAIKAAHEADVCQTLLVEFEQRGVATPEVVKVLRVRRNAARVYERECSHMYSAITAATREP